MTQMNQAQLNKQRLDKFLVVITLPPALMEISTGDLGEHRNTKIIHDALQFSVYGAIVPTIQVPEITQPYAGQTYKLSSHSRPAYPNISVNFTVDSRFNNYWILYKWLDILNNEKESIYDSNNLMETPTLPTKSRNKDRSLTPPKEYQTDITLYAKDEFDKEIVKFTYKKAFPVSLGAINWNYRTDAEVETTFEFAFSQLLVDLISNDTP